jgi:hypothetical protein
VLTAEEQGRIVEALYAWARSVPDEPMIGFLAHEGFLTPRQLAEHVSEHTEEGVAVLEILEHGVRREGLGKVLERLTRRYHGSEFSGSG